MRADEFIREEDQLNEVIPLIGLAARGVAGAAKGMAKGAAKAANGMLSKTPQDDQTIGAPDTPTTPAAQTATSTDPARNRALDRAKDQIIKPGANVKLPTSGTGGPEEFKISKIQGDNVEIENPAPAPGEPKKTVYKKDDVKKSMSL